MINTTTFLFEYNSKITETHNGVWCYYFSPAKHKAMQNKYNCPFPPLTSESLVDRSHHFSDWVWCYHLFFLRWNWCWGSVSDAWCLERHIGNIMCSSFDTINFLLDIRSRLQKLGLQRNIWDIHYACKIRSVIYRCDFCVTSTDYRIDWTWRNETRPYMHMICPDYFARRNILGGICF